MSDAQGIPTVYRNIRFRSRLEAKWACYLDKIEWAWTYEPFDLDGYIPDFIVDFPHAPLLIEVKPEVRLQDLEQHTGKLEASGWQNEMLIVGARLWDSPWTYGMTSPGLLSQRMVGLVENDDGTITVDPTRTERAWDAGELIICPECHQTAIYHPCQCWYCYRCGNGHKVYRGPEHPWQDLWADATNAMQWAPRRNGR